MPNASQTLTLLVMMLLASFSRAQDNTMVFEEKLKAGTEVALLLDQTKSTDGQIALIYSARPKDAKPADWPLFMSKFHYIGTVAEGESDGFVSENWVVSLVEKKRLGRLRWQSKNAMVFHPDDRRAALRAAWTASLDGARLGFVVYDSDGITCGAQIIALDNGELRSIDVLDSFNQAASDFISRQEQSHLSSYQFLFQVTNTGFEERLLERGGTTFYQIGFETLVNRAATDNFNGTIHLRVTSRPGNPPDLTIVGVTKPGATIDYSLLPPTRPAIPLNPPSSPKEFAELRLLYNKISDGKLWKSVTRDLPKNKPAHEHSIVGWMEGKELMMLMRVESSSKQDIATTFYYFHKGSLVSVFARRKSPATRPNQATDVTETYNFLNGKLLSWRQTPGPNDGYIDPKDQRFAAQGQKILQAAAKLARPFLDSPP